MKKLNILILIILLNFLIVPFAKAEETVVQNNEEITKTDEIQKNKDVDFKKMKFNENENPVTYKYFTDYADLLRSKINFNKFYFFGYRPQNQGWYMSYHYKLHKDGTISELSPTLGNSPYEGKPINKYYENIIQTVLPPPFPNNIEIGDDVYVILVVERKARTRTEILFLEESGIYHGNTVIIYLYKKTWENVINKKYEYIRDAQWQYRKDMIDGY